MTLAEVITMPSNEEGKQNGSAGDVDKGAANRGEQVRDSRGF